jgi:branched-chain amino acid transport system permease protein
MVYNVTTVFDLTLGQYVMLGAMSSATLYPRGFSLPIAIVLAVIITVLVSALLWLIFMRRAMQNSPHLTQVLLTVGVMIIITGVAQLVFGTGVKVLPPFIKMEPIRITSHAVITSQALWVWGMLLLATVAVSLLYNYSMLGKALRAVRDYPLAARLSGIRPLNMMHLSYVIAALIGAITGAVMIPMTSASFGIGYRVVVYGLIAAIVGGVTRMRGPVVAGLSLGLLEQFAGGFISSDYMEAIALSVFLVLLLVRPTGLLGAKEVRSEVKKVGKE